MNQDKKEQTPTPEGKLTFKIEIVSKKQETVVKERKFNTRVSADTLEEAFKNAVEKAVEMKETDPEHAVYTVNAVNLA